MSETDIDEFLTQRPPKKTKLDAWESHIFELFARNATYETIKEYLKTKDVTVNISSIAEFVKAKKRAHLYEKAMQQRGKPVQSALTQQKPEPQATQPKEPTPTESPNQNLAQTQNTPLATDIPKFEWDVKNKPKSRW